MNIIQVNCKFYWRNFSGSTTWNKAHIHHFGGITTKAVSGVPLVHNMGGSTTFNLEHKHPYITKTGPAIFLKNGHHIHYFKTKVEIVKVIFNKANT